MTALQLKENTQHPEPSVDRVLYTQFFGLKALPFSLTPDPEFFFSHPSNQDATNKLLFATRTGEGFVKVTGEVGAGKTLLCRSFLSMLSSQYITAYIPNPYMDPLTLLMAISDELGIAYAPRPNQHELLKSLTEFLIDSYAKERKTVVICLDEAHALPRPSMEVLRLLSNLETAKRKLLQLILFGQPELDERLQHRSIRQLRQRISFSGRLESLSHTETEDYVSHRLSVAGYQGPRLFNRAAMRLFCRASQGIPRLINILAHKSMIAAYSEGARTVTPKHVSLAIEDTDSLEHQKLKNGNFNHYKAYVITLLLGSVATACAASLYNLIHIAP